MHAFYFFFFLCNSLQFPVVDTWVSPLWFSALKIYACRTCLNIQIKLDIQIMQSYIVLVQLVNNNQEAHGVGFPEL